jgi:prophage endopeptidase
MRQINPRLVVVYALAAILFLSGWTINGWRWESKVADIRLEVSESALQAAIDARDKRRTLQDKISALDAQKTKELNRAKSEINRMRESVANGTGWLSFNANCPKLPGLTIDSGLGDGAAPRLTDSAQSAYFVLREGAETCVKQVEVLQGAIRAIQESFPAP